MTNPGATRQLLVADSFRVRVREGRAEVRAWEAHVGRFRSTVCDAIAPAAGSVAHADELRARAEQALRADVGTWGSFEVTAVRSEIGGHTSALLDDFLTEAADRIAAYGEGFPRLELWREPDGGLSFELSLRPLPELRDTIELRTAGNVALDHAEWKGPNIAVLGELNRSLGAEALLTGPACTVREGATTSLIVWRDESDSSGCVIASGVRVDSVTEGVLVEAAARRLVGEKPNRSRTGGLVLGGFGRDRDRDPTPAQLHGLEVWAVNALHGIRPVTHIDGVPQPTPNESRLRWFREALDRAWTPIRG
ncbi:aminotransferase class IV [Leucobacter chromiireducens]|uniref:aminotransferase class IV n=1 Tax=Leucobacter chromiireducens TaxID=283877 RepID=UPI0013DE1D73|nr:aminotransferase class IV [Leucobacter chromiireducens]